MKSDMPALVLSVSSRYVITYFPCTAVLMAVHISDFLVPYWLCIIIFWLGSSGYQTIHIHINGQGNFFPVCPLYSWVVVVLWGTPSPSLYLYSIICTYVLSYTVTNITPVVSPSVCLNVSNVFQLSSYLVLTNWPHVVSWGISQYFPQRYPSALLCDVLDASLPVDQNYPPFLNPFHVLHWWLKIVLHILFSPCGSTF